MSESVATAGHASACKPPTSVFERLLAFWVVLNVIFGLGVVSIAGTEGEIAWEAHVGGFLFGLLCFGFVDRGIKPTVPQQP